MYKNILERFELFNVSVLTPNEDHFNVSFDDLCRLIGHLLAHSFVDSAFLSMMNGCDFVSFGIGNDFIVEFHSVKIDLPF